MRARWYTNVVLMGALAALAGSCAHHKERFSPTVSREVEPALLRISDGAQNTIAAAADDNWPRVLAYVRDISDAWRDYKQPTVVPVSAPRPPSTLLYGRIDAALARLRTAAAGQKRYETMRAANEVDAAAMDLVEYYNPTVPPDLRRLRILEQRVALDAAEGKTGTTSDSLRKVRGTWRRVRPVLEDRASLNAVETFENNLAVQQTALNERNWVELGASARRAVVLINEMERLSY